MTDAAPPPAPDGEGPLRRRPGVALVALDATRLLVHGDRVSRLLSGAVYPRLLQWLDGNHDADGVATRLDPEFPAAVVYYALMQLESIGAIASAGLPASTPPADRSAATQGVGDSWARWMVAAGIAESPAVAPRPVVVQNYFDPHLQSINAEQLRARAPWMVLRPGPEIWWVGPLFRPGQTGCWACLEHRLRRNQPLDAWVAAHPEAAVAPFHPESGVESVRSLLDAWVATRGDEHGEADPLAGVLLLVDTAEGTIARHPAPQRPECPACGDPDLVRRRPGKPVPLSGAVPVDWIGGYRTAAPEQTLARWAGLIDPLTGVVPTLTRSAASGRLHVYAAGGNPAHPEAGWDELRASLRRSSGGKGLTDLQARLSALGESVERYSGWFTGAEPRRTARLADLGPDAVHPNASMLFSDRQYDERDQLGAGPWGLDPIPRPFDPGAPEDWTPVWSLTRRCRRWAPTALVYYRVGPRATATALADSNGCAAGTTMAEAVLQGLLELVERDATAIWWYNRLARPPVALAGLLPDWADLEQEYARLDREVWALDLTHDLGIPVVAAVARHAGPGPERLVLGLGAGLDQRVAAVRAVTEMHQMLLTAGDDADTDRAGFGAWLRDATVADHPYLAPARDAPRAPVEAPAPAGDLAGAIGWCVERLARRGHEVLVLDQTRPELEIPVVKVLVPGLRHFRARYAPGRLYRVPVDLGWRAHPLTEQELNPLPFFL